MKNAKKIAFFGTPPFTVDFLDALYDEGYVPSLIVTNPDRPAGRGMHLQAPEPKEWAITQGIRTLQPEKIDASFVELLAQETWDLFVVVAYGAILPEALIALPRFGTINVHYSLLPKYRGATPVESAILHGDSTTGVCIQQMRFALDSGPLLAQSEVPIDQTDTTETLRTKLNERALALLPEVLAKIFDGTVTPREQDESAVSICKKIKKSDGLIDLEEDGLGNDRKYRAYHHSPGTFFIIEKNGVPVRVKIKAAHLEGTSFVLDTVVPENGKPLSKEEFDRWVIS
jgi:methionyl-tRNA formyltransferase